MTPEQIGYAIGVGIPSALGIGFGYLILRRALLGGEGSMVQRLWIVALAGVCAVGLYAFNEGEGGFVNRLTNIPSMTNALAYAIAALIVMVVVVRNATPRSPELEPEIRKFSAGRIGAILLSVPFIVLGLGNLTGSAYVAATEGIPGPGLGSNATELRQIMLDGEMGPVWRIVDEKAPLDLDTIINEIIKREDSFLSEEDVAQALSHLALSYRLELSSFGPAMSDQQRKMFLQSQTGFIRAFRDDPENCAIVANRGVDALPKGELVSRLPAFNLSMATMFSILLDARENSRQGGTLPASPTDEDYGLLIERLLATGIPFDRLMASLDGDTSQPDYCGTLIAFMDELTELGGAAGERLRFETAQILLTAVPEQ